MADRIHSKTVLLGWTPSDDIVRKALFLWPSMTALAFCVKKKSKPCSGQRYRPGHGALPRWGAVITSLEMERAKDDA
jgi:hypothetical protein